MAPAQEERPGTPTQPFDAIELHPESRLLRTITELLKGPADSRSPQAHSTTRRHEKKPKISSVRGSRHGHSHSHSASFQVPPASPIDTLASVAALHSPVPHNSPPGFYGFQQSQYSPMTNGFPAQQYERPSKRARSEVMASPNAQTSPLFEQSASIRPATSYNFNGWGGYNVEQAIDNGQRAAPVDEAELLLNFARGGSVSSSNGLRIHTQEPKSVHQTPSLPPFPYASADATIATASSSHHKNDEFSAISNLKGYPSTSPQTDEHQDPRLHTSFQSYTPPDEMNMPDRSDKASASDDLTKSTEHEVKEAVFLDGNACEPHTHADRMDISPPAQLKSPDITSDETTEHGELSGHSNPPTEDPNWVSNTEERRFSGSQREGYSDTAQSSFAAAQSKFSVRSSNPLIPSTAEASASAEVSKGDTPPEPSLRLHEQGIVCPACKFAADIMSDKVDWMQCDGCDQWFHAACAGFSAKQSERIDKYYCKSCVLRFGKSTWKRKSTRVRQTVDYAGLNEGVLRMPDETREHHYIEAIKTGNMNLTPETFLRMPGNEITSEFLEKTNSFCEPIVIPGYLNPRPSFPGTSSGAKAEQSAAGDEDAFVSVLDDGQDDLDMVIPQELTVRRVAELFGPKNVIPVIDVKAQESSKGWTVEKWADYYESVGDKPIRNVISLECSSTPLGRLIRRPKVVRDLDLQDQVWPENEWKKSVGFYVLMSVADCFTDFHIDFGGSSVYYHILKGKKVFFFIPPTPTNLQKYQDWNDMPSQNWTWLPDQTKTKECFRVDLNPGDTMLIPAGWIHAVWTPEDSLVIGGNFLTRLHYGMQFKVAQVEKANKTPVAFRYPKFQKVMWYTVLQYLDKDPLPESVLNTFFDGNRYERARPVWSEFDQFGENSDPGPENYNFRYYSKAEVDGLPDMVNYIFRTVMIFMDRLENIHKEARKAVSESIPKGKGDPLEIAQKFAMWVAWKRGNEDVPEWAHPGAVLPNKPEDPAEKKLSDAQFKKLQRTSAISAPERQSLRLKFVAEAANQYELSLQSSTPKTSTLGPRRTACDSCRKRKMRCKHVEPGDPPFIFVPNILQDISPPASLQGAPAVLPPQPIAAYYPPPPSEPPAPIEIIETTPFTPGRGQDSADKKGRTKACYDCRRSKRRCIHDEFGKVDPIKQREPVVPRGSAKRKQGPSPELPLAKKPATDQVAPVAPMFVSTASFESSTSSINPSAAWGPRQDGMFRNSTVNDFNGVVNVNPLASQRDGSMQDDDEQQSPMMSAGDWALDPALVNDGSEATNGYGAMPEHHGMDPNAIDPFFDYEPPNSEARVQVSIEDQILAMAGNYVQQVEAEGGPPVDPKLGAVNHVVDPAIDPAIDSAIDSAIDPALDPAIDPAIDPAMQDYPPRVQTPPVDPAMRDYPPRRETPAVDPELMEMDLPVQPSAEVVTHDADGDVVLTNGVDEHQEVPFQKQEAESTVEEPVERPNGIIMPTTEKSPSRRHSSRDVKPVDRFAPEPSSSNSNISPAKRRQSVQAPHTPLTNGTGASMSPEVGRSNKAFSRQRSVKLEARDESAMEDTEMDEDTKRLIETLRQENLQTKGLRRRS